MKIINWHKKTTLNAVQPKTDIRKKSMSLERDSLITISFFFCVQQIDKICKWRF